MTTERALLRRTAELAADYLETLDTRPIRPERRYAEMLAELDGPVPDGPTDALAVVEELVARGEPGITGMGSGRYYGFVIGGSVPAATAVDWLVTTWDQNTGLAEVTPTTSALETVAGRWVLDLLGLPSHCTFAFVTGCQMAHVTCLAVARHAVYARAGVDLPAQGLASAPPLRVIVGDKRHVTLTGRFASSGSGARRR